jgi:hypothetical protein
VPNNHSVESLDSYIVDLEAPMISYAILVCLKANPENAPYENVLNYQLKIRDAASSSLLGYLDLVTVLTDLASCRR